MGTVIQASVLTVTGSFTQSVTITASGSANISAGSFTVTESGSQEFKPEGQWRYTIYWHLK